MINSKKHKQKYTLNYEKTVFDLGGTTVEGKHKFLFKKRIRLFLPIVLVIVWCISSTVVYVYQFKHLFEKILKLLITL